MPSAHAWLTDLGAIPGKQRLHAHQVGARDQCLTAAIWEIWAQGFPAINVYAHQDGIVITAELPGVKEDDLDITVHRDTVTLRGQRRDPISEAGGYHRRERRTGSFGRTFSLPFNVDPERVEAKLRNGILTLTLHRPEQDKPRRIRVSAGS